MDEEIHPTSERAEFLYGRGGWPAFRRIGAKLSDITNAAMAWRDQLDGVARPWLVWNAHPDWCWIQQNLVESIGWTPIVGFDPRIGPPENVTANALVVDFNRDLKLSFMHPVFVLEFVYLFADTLAFWHSDLLIPYQKLQTLARRFAALKQGETIATSIWRVERFWRRPQRVWELIGCTTQEASRDQFEKGAGWWSNIYAHVNCPSSHEAERRRAAICWDHGGGILYWKRNYGGSLKTIPISFVEEGHFSPTSFPDRYERIGSRETRHLRSQLDHIIGVEDACRRVGIDVELLCRPHHLQERQPRNAIRP